MKKIIFLIVICSLFLIGCKGGNVAINYEGKSQSWDVSYKIEGTEKSHGSYYTFKFIGNDNKPESENGKFSLDNKDECTGKMSITGGIPNTNDRDIRVKLEWNGKTETVMLKRSMIWDLEVWTAINEHSFGNSAVTLKNML